MVEILIRIAQYEDLTAIVGLLAKDELGKLREVVRDPPDKRYIDAFLAIDADDNQILAVIEQNQKITGCLQLSFIPGLSRAGMWRAQIESVRISNEARGMGQGRALIEWAVNQARDRHCGLVQLTTDKLRPDALRFYQELGFTASHEGMKLSL